MIIYETLDNIIKRIIPQVKEKNVLPLIATIKEAQRTKNFNPVRMLFIDDAVTTILLGIPEDTHDNLEAVHIQDVIPYSNKLETVMILCSRELN